MEYIPSTDQLSYYASIIDKNYYDDFATEEAYIQDDIEYFSLLAEHEGMAVEEMIAKLTSKGNAEVPYSKLTPNTEYIAYAFGVNTDGSVTSALFSKPFTTPKPGASENQLTLKISKIGIDGALIEAATTNADPYILDVWEVSKLAGKTDAEIIETLLAAYDEEELGQITTTGDTPLDVTGKLLPATEYIALAFGYEAGVVTTALKKESFETKPGDWVDCSFTIVKESLTSRSASFTVKASDETTPFFFAMIPAAKLAETGGTDDALSAYLLEKIQEEADYFGYPLATYLKLLLFRSSHTEKYTSITPKSEFHIVAAGISQEGTVITRIVISDKYTAPDISAATITFGQPEINGSTVTVSVQASADTPSWKGAGMGFSSTYMSDASMYDHLLSEYVPVNPATLSFSFTEDDENIYFYAVGLDASGNPGKLVKLTVPVK